MRRYFAAIVLALAMLAPPAASAETTPAGSIDSVSSEGTLSTQGLSKTISFDVTVTCTAGDFAFVEALLFHVPGHRRFGTGTRFVSEPVLCTGRPQTVTLTQTITSDPPFVVVPGTDDVFFVKLTVCDPTLSVCELVDEVQSTPLSLLPIHLVHGP